MKLYHKWWFGMAGKCTRNGGLGWRAHVPEITLLLGFVGYDVIHCQNDVINCKNDALKRNQIKALDVTFPTMSHLSVYDLYNSSYGNKL